MRKTFFYIICAALVFSPSLTAAGVKVMLKNGREIRADSCEEESGRLVCEKMGGTFDIEKKKVERVEETGGGYNVPEGEPEVQNQSEDGKRPEEAQGTDLSGLEKPHASGQTGADRRLTEITQRKKELYTEREKLVNEREQFQEDLENAPDWMPTRQYEELEKRSAEITEKINRFNDEAAKLREEEKRIAESQKKKD